MRKARASLGDIGSDGECCHKNWPITARANAEGRMGREEFKQRLQTNTLESCPKAADVPGKRVMIEVSGSPRWLHSQKLRGQGFHLHSCVLSSTAVMQETDQNCGALKSVRRQTQRELTKDWWLEKENQSISNQLLWDCWSLAEQMRSLGKMTMSVDCKSSRKSRNQKSNDFTQQ